MEMGLYCDNIKLVKKRTEKVVIPYNVVRSLVKRENMKNRSGRAAYMIHPFWTTTEEGVGVPTTAKYTGGRK